MIDLEEHKRGDRYKVYLNETGNSFDENVLTVKDIVIKIKRGLRRKEEYIELEDILDYIFVAKELKDSLERLLEIEKNISKENNINFGLHLLDK